MVERSWMAQFDSPEFWNPKVRGAECLNRQAARSILPIADLRTRMVMAGHSKAEIDNKQLPDLENGNMGEGEAGVVVDGDVQGLPARELRATATAAVAANLTSDANCAACSPPYPVASPRKPSRGLSVTQIT